jgi:hypothetical protein
MQPTEFEILLLEREGRVTGKQSTCARARSAGVVGAARRKGGSGNRGRPVWCEGSGLNVASGGGMGGSRTVSYDAGNPHIRFDERG